MDLTAIRKAIANNARTVDGLEDCKHYDPGMTHGSPAFWVTVNRQTRSERFGSTNWRLELSGVLTLLGTWDRSKSEQADRLATDVFNAIDVNNDLGGRVCDTYVESATWDTDEDDGTVTVTYSIVVEV